MELFHNTVNLRGNDLLKQQSKCFNQEEFIFKFFKNNPDSEFTPPQICDKLFNNSIPLTSVRRAMTNLSKKSLLLKTGNKKLGIYGMENYTWKLK